MSDVFHPLVSIVIPVYNGADFVAQAIDSALAQTYDNLEIIVVNDGSCDNGATEAVVKEYGDKVRYFLKPNGGVSSALNYGIEQMKGEYFSWLSHDDLYVSGKIETEIQMLSRMQDRENTIVVCADNLIDKDGNLIFHPALRLDGVYSGPDLFDVFFTKHLNINGCTLLIPKSVFTRFGGFGRFRYIQDTERWITFMLADITFCFIPDRLVEMRVHPGQVTQRMPELYFIEMKEFSNGIIDKYIATHRLPISNIRSFLSFHYKNRNKKIYHRIEQLSGQSMPIKKMYFIAYGIVFDWVKKAYLKLIKR